MIDPSSTAHRLAVGFLVLVTASAGLMAVQGEASTTGVAGAMAVGLGLGCGLLWYLSRLGRQFRERS